MGYFLDAVEDHAIARLQAFTDYTQAIGYTAQADITALCYVVFVNDIDVLVFLIRHHGLFINEYSLERAATLQAHSGIEPGRKQAIRIRQCAAHSYRAC